MRKCSDMNAKILVVEDNPAARVILVMLLAHAGYEVIEAANGSEAIDEAMRYTPDLIFTDLGLPGMQGDEVTRRIRSNPRVASTPIIITTAFDFDAAVVRRAISAGANEVLFKPIDFKRLLDIARIFTHAARDSRPRHLQYTVARPNQ